MTQKGGSFDKDLIRELAALQLTQARDRFAAGVASNLEIIQAQESVAHGGKR